MDEWVYVGDEWINISSDAKTVIKEVCGSYPSSWTGKKCSELYPILMQGASLLNSSNPSKYAVFLPERAYSSIPRIRDFLMRVADQCDRYPEAILDVDF